MSSSSPNNNLVRNGKMSIINRIKDIADLIKKLNDIELYRKIVELEGDIIELTRINRDLEERVSELKNR